MTDSKVILASPKDPGDIGRDGDVRGAVQRISEMPVEDFFDFHRELHYAARREKIRSTQANQAASTYHEGKHIPKNVLDEALNGGKRAKDIFYSPFYEAVRDRLRKLVVEQGGEASTIPIDWTGWSNFRPEDAKTIDDSLKTIAKHDMPSQIIMANRPTAEEVNSAEQSIESLGIEGTFVGQVSQVEIATAFDDRWGAEVQSHP